jgi:hypothetical protein
VCLGAGFFSLIVPFGLSLGSFLVGATLMVDSSSLGTMAGAVSIASIAREAVIPLLLLADAAMVAPMGGGSWLMMESQGSRRERFGFREATRLREFRSGFSAYGYSLMALLWGPMFFWNIKYSGFWE